MVLLALDDLRKDPPGCHEEGPEGTQASSSQEATAVLQMGGDYRVGGTDGFWQYFRGRT